MEIDKETFLKNIDMAEESKVDYIRAERDKYRQALEMIIVMAGLNTSNRIRDIIGIAKEALEDRNVQF